MNVDAKHKFIRRFEVTSASVHDSQAVKNLLDKKNSGKEVYADSAYVGEEIASLLHENDLQSRINEKGYRNRPLTELSKRIESGKIEDTLTCGAYLWRAISTRRQFTFAGHWNRSSQDKDRIAKLIVQPEAAMRC